MPQYSPEGSSRGVLGRMIFGGGATCHNESGHVPGIAKSVCYAISSAPLQWGHVTAKRSPDAQYAEGTEGRMPAEESVQCVFVPW